MAAPRCTSPPPLTYCVFIANLYIVRQSLESTSTLARDLRHTSKASRKLLVMAPDLLSRVGTVHRWQTFVASNVVSQIVTLRD